MADHILSLQVQLLGLLPHALVVLLLLWLTWGIWYSLRPRDHHSLRSVAILVLGDIGRSPRMMYHAQSFAENGFMTDVVGYGGSRPIPALERLPKVQLRYLPEPPAFVKWLPFIMAAPIKVIHQVVTILLVLLVWIEVPPEFIVVQNPPSIPTLALVQLVGRIRGSKIIIDWHNLGYTILAMRLGETHLFVRVYKWFERTFGRYAYAHLFVTQAMRDFLVEEWHLEGHKVVLYDRPPRHFHRSSAQEIHELFRKLQPKLATSQALYDFLPSSTPPYSTILTQAPAQGLGTNTKYNEIQMPALRPDRPALLVSSTSWTADEDFSILLDALRIYEKRATEAKTAGKEALPKVLVIVTGKGPLREKYMAEIGKMQQSWNWVRCISLWLEAEDYPVLLGSADLGISLHSSSSGRDLPMKVVDMFGCGLPVCALGFPCLPELVKDGKNGLIFYNSTQLGNQLEVLLNAFPTSPKLRSLASSLSISSQRSPTPSYTHPPKLSADNDKPWKWNTWDENWGRAIRPLILRDVNL